MEEEVKCLEDEIKMIDGELQAFKEEEKSLDQNLEDSQGSHFEVVQVLEGLRSELDRLLVNTHVWNEKLDPILARVSDPTTSVLSVLPCQLWTIRLSYDSIIVLVINKSCHSRYCTTYLEIISNSLALALSSCNIFNNSEPILLQFVA